MTLSLESMGQFRPGNSSTEKKARRESRRWQKLQEILEADYDDNQECEDDFSEESLDALDVLGKEEISEKSIMNKLHSSYGCDKSLNYLSARDFVSCNEGLHYSVSNFESFGEGLNYSVSDFSCSSPTRSESRFVEKTPQSPTSTPTSTTVTDTAKQSPWGVKLRSRSPSSRKPVNSPSSLQNCCILEEFLTPRQLEMSSFRNNSSGKSKPSTMTSEKTPDADARLSYSSKRPKALDNRKTQSLHQFIQGPGLELGGESDDDASTVTSIARSVESRQTTSHKTLESTSTSSTESTNSSTEESGCHPSSKVTTRRDEKKARELDSKRMKDPKRQRYAEERKKRRALEAHRRAEEKARQEREAKFAWQEQREKKMWGNMQDLVRKQMHAKFCKQQQSDIHRLEKKLAAVQQDTVSKVSTIRHEATVTNENLRQRFVRRHQMNVNRCRDTDAALRQVQEKVEDLQRDNTLIRQQNERLRKDILQLRTNNERLGASNAELGRCTARLQHRIETSTLEQQKLLGICQEYEKAVAQVEEHLELHKEYAETESKIVDAFDRSILTIVARIEHRGKSEPELVQEVQTLAVQLKV